MEALSRPQAVKMLRFLIAGQLRRDFLLPPVGEPKLDVPGGSLLYAGVGLRVWESEVGLIGRVGEDYPFSWLQDLEQWGLDRRGIQVLSEPVDLRWFAAYPDSNTCITDNPVTQFAERGLPFPKDLLDYSTPPLQLDSRIRVQPLTLRLGDIPADYLDAGAAHLCPLDYLSHNLLPSVLRQGHITTITLDPSLGYMSPTYWDDIPALVTGTTAFLPSENKLRNLFQGRSSNLWEMAEAISGFGCEIVVIKRGERGQYLYDGYTHTRWIIPAYPVHLVDPTGAGDAFCGGFLAGYCRTYDPLQAALHGNISASMVVEGSRVAYALDSLPGLADARLMALKDMVRKV